MEGRGSLGAPTRSRWGEPRCGEERCGQQALGVPGPGVGRRWSIQGAEMGVGRPGWRGFYLSRQWEAWKGWKQPGNPPSFHFSETECLAAAGYGREGRALRGGGR